MTSPELFPQKGPQPEQDPFAADRAFNDAYTTLAEFEAPAGDNRFMVRDNETPRGTQRNLNVMSGDRKHAVATSLFPGEHRAISVTVKGAPANGKPNIAFMFAPSQVSLMLYLGWNPREERSVVYMQVDRGPHYSPDEAQFMQDTGLSAICPDEYVQAVEPGGVQLYQIEPSALASLTDMPNKAAELPPAA